MTSVLSSFIQIMVGGISDIASGVGSGLSTLAQNIFLTGTGESQALSVFGGVIALMAGISLAIGLSRWVVSYLTSLGARN